MASQEFNYIFFLTTGLFFGFLSWGLVFTFLYIFFFELIYLSYNIMFYKDTELDKRLVYNFLFLFGWTISRLLFLRETGFEYCSKVSSDPRTIEECFD